MLGLAGWLLAGLCLLAAAPAAQAQTVPLVSNVGQADAAGLFGSVYAELTSYDLAQAFMTGGNEEGYTLRSVDVELGPVEAAATYSVGIWSSDEEIDSTADGDAIHEPHASLGALSCPSLTVSTSDAVYKCTTTGIELAKETTYLFVIDSGSGDDNHIQGTFSDSEDFGAATGWSIHDRYILRNRDETGGWRATTIGTSLKVRINGIVKSPPVALVSNIGQTASVVHYDMGPANSFSVYATSFSTGTTGAVLTGIDVRLRNPGSSPVATIPTVTVYEGTVTGGSLTLGNALASLNGPTSIASGTANYTFSAPANTNLKGSTTYYVLFELASGNVDLVYITSSTLDNGGRMGWNIPYIRYFRASANTGPLSGGGFGSILMRVRGSLTNTPPMVENEIPDQTATVGVAFEYAFPDDTFNDTDTSDTLTYTATRGDGTSLPTWLSLDAATRTFSGVPTATDVGTLTVKVLTSDGRGGSASDEFDIVVGAAMPSATVLISNLGQATDDNTGASRGAQAFTTGAHANGYTLASIVLDGSFAGYSAGTVTLHSGTRTGTKVADFNASASGAILTLTPTTDTTLAASTTYVVVTANDFAPGTVEWWTAASGNEDTGGAAGWSIADGSELFRTSSMSWETSTHPRQITVNGSPKTSTTPNTAATGTPTIIGTAQVGQTLTANQGDIDDTDGLPGGPFPTGYTFQWVRVVSGVDSDISGATSRTYILDTADVGHTIKVKVSFTDGANNPETRTSTATDTVVAMPVQGTCNSSDTNEVWCTTIPSIASIDDFLGRGYVAAAHPSTDSGGTLGDGDFDIAGTTYTVWRVTVSTAATGSTANEYLTIATGTMLQTTRLPDESELSLELTPSGGTTVTYLLSDATFNDSTDSASEQGYEWSTKFSGDPWATGSTGTVKLIRSSTNNPPSVANEIPDQTATEGQAFSFQFNTNTFADDDAGDTLTYTATLSDDARATAYKTIELSISYLGSHRSKPLEFASSCS